MQTYIVNRENEKIISYLLDEKLKPIEISSEGINSQLQVGDVLLGRVSRVAWNIQAAFVDVGMDRDCYLPLEDLQSPVFIKKGASPRLQQGDELIVQVKRAALKTKAAALTTAICVKGRYLAVTSGRSQTGVSRKLPEEKRQVLKALAEELSAGTWDVVVRTNAGEAEELSIREEFHSLTDRLEQIRKKALHSTCPSVLLQDGALWLRKLRDLSETDTKEILLEDAQLYSEAVSYLQTEHPELLDRVRFYQDALWPMSKRFSLEGCMKAATERRVWLKSGAYLLFEPGETLTAIDVNTGSIGPGKLKNHREETFFKVNMEAVYEIARQIRLRGISGVILIDFINMESKDANAEMMQALAAAVAKDPVKTRVIDMTGLGLVELTRKKIERSLQ